MVGLGRVGSGRVPQLTLFRFLEADGVKALGIVATIFTGQVMAYTFKDIQTKHYTA